MVADAALSSVPASKAAHCGESEEERDTIRLLSGK